MKARTSLRALVLGVAIVGGVGLPGPPASAAAVTTTIHGASSIDIGALRIYLDGDCAPATMDLDLTATAVTITDITAVEVVTFGGNDYLVEISDIWSGAGDVAGSTPATIGGTTKVEVGIKADVYVLATAPCTPGPLVCEAAAGIEHTGSYSANPAAPATGNTAFLAGADNVGGLQSFGVCAAPISSLLGQAVLTDIYLTVV